MADISAWLDRDSQLVCQKIDGPLNPEEFQRLLDLTAECVAQWRNPADVRILVDARTMDGSDRTTRKLGIDTLNSGRVTRMALWGARAKERVVQRFMMALLGEKRLGLFATEEEARAWLTNDRSPSASGAAGAPKP